MSSSTTETMPVVAIDTMSPVKHNADSNAKPKAKRTKKSETLPVPDADVTTSLPPPDADSNAKPKAKRTTKPKKTEDGSAPDVNPIPIPNPVSVSNTTDTESNTKPKPKKSTKSKKTETPATTDATATDATATDATATDATATDATATDANIVPIPGPDTISEKPTSDASSETIQITGVPSSKYNIQYLTKLTVPQLKELCTQNNVSITIKHKKADIITALMKIEKSNETPEAAKDIVAEIIIAANSTYKHTAPKPAATETETAEEDSNTVVTATTADTNTVGPCSEITETRIKLAKVPELKELCKKYKLTVSGCKKEDLVAKLIQHIQTTKSTDPIHTTTDDNTSISSETKSETKKRSPKSKKETTSVESSSDTSSVSSVNTTTNPFEKMTVAKLKEECTKRNISINNKAKKQNIIEALMQYDAKKSEPTPTEQPATPIESEISKAETESTIHMVEPKNNTKKFNTPILNEEPEDDEIVETNTVLLTHNGVQYWMDVEPFGDSMHDIYSYETLNHLGYFDKLNSTIQIIEKNINNNIM